MTNSIDQFFDDIKLEVDAHSDAFGDLTEDAFFEVATSYLIDSGDISQCERVCYIRQGVQIDGYIGDPRDEEGVLSIFLVDYSQSLTPVSLNKGDLDSLCKRGVSFISKCISSKFADDLEETSPVSSLADLISRRWPEISKIRLVVLTNKILKMRSSILPEYSVNDIACSVSLWDLSRFYLYSVSGKAKEDILVDLSKDFGGPVAALSAHLSDTDYRSYLAVMPGLQLAQIYAKWGTQLLEKNVRVFLQARGKVNKGIRETIENEPTMLFAYNNGITATAESVNTEPTKNGLAIMSVVNLQIVNGGQTTASIFDAWRRKKDLSKVFVQMKLSVVDSRAAEEVVPNISKYANSQNKVNAADFFSNHPFHITVEKLSRQITAPRVDGSLQDSKWFYERARGQFADQRSKNQSSSDKRKFDLVYPRAQLITKTDLAKYLNTWDRKPSIVSKGAQANFATFSLSIGQNWKSNSGFFNDVFFKHSVSKAILFRGLEKSVSSQPWYQGGYRANVVIYTLSLLSNTLFTRGKEFDFNKIWQRQVVDEVLMSELSRVSHTVYLHLVKPPIGSPTNVTEYAKTLRCWEYLLERKIQWTKAIDPYIISKSALVEENRMANKQTSFKEGVASQAEFLSKGAGFWLKLSRWSSTNMDLSPNDRDILLKATRSGFCPTEKQAKYLLLIHMRAVSSDFLEDDPT